MVKNAIQIKSGKIIDVSPEIQENIRYQHYICTPSMCVFYIFVIKTQWWFSNYMGWDHRYTEYYVNKFSDQKSTNIMDYCYCYHYYYC